MDSEYLFHDFTPLNRDWSIELDPNTTVLELSAMLRFLGPWVEARPTAEGTLEVVPRCPQPPPPLDSLAAAFIWGSAATMRAVPSWRL